MRSEQSKSLYSKQLQVVLGQTSLLISVDIDRIVAIG